MFNRSKKKKPFFTAAGAISVIGFKQLLHEYEIAIQHNDSMALLIAGNKAAASYGCAGLLLQLNAIHATLPAQLATSATVQKQAIQALGILLAVQAIVNSNSTEAENIREQFPNIDIEDPAYWTQLIDELCELGNIAADETSALQQKAILLAHYETAITDAAADYTN